MDTEVLVAGAGPTGLTLAIDLARRGVAVRIVDKAATFFAGSRGDGLQPRTLEVFEDLGVLDAVLAAGIPPFRIRAYADGAFSWEGWMSEPREPTPALPYPNAWFLGQSHTERILREHLAEFGVHVELNTRLTGLTQDADGVTATLGAAAGTELVRSAYLVGADGGGSFVREALGIGFEGSTDESIKMLLGDIHAEGLDHRYGHWFSSSDESGPGFGLTPLSGGAQFQFATPLADDAELTVPYVQRALDAHRGPMDIRLHGLTWATRWRANKRLATRFRQDRVFLAGDAAHVHPPTGGQGLNTGVGDAYNLGWKLADGAEELLASYEAERRPVAARVLGMSSRLLDSHTRGDADALERGEDTKQLDISYAAGPLSRDERSTPGSVQSGDRAPDAPVLDGTGRPIRLFDLFRGPHATVLRFDEGPGESIVDHEGHAFDGFDVVAGTVMLIRPDGYIGAVTFAPRAPASGDDLGRVTPRTVAVRAGTGAEGVSRSRAGQR